MYVHYKHHIFSKCGEKDSESNYGETEAVFKPTSGYFRLGNIGVFCENGIGLSLSIILLQNYSNN